MAEVALMGFAEKVTLAPHEVTKEDIAALRAHGFSDTEVLDIAMTVGARSFFSKVLDAVGAEPDERYRGLEEGFRKALSVGRPFGKAPETL